MQPSVGWKKSTQISNQRRTITFVFWLWLTALELKDRIRAVIGDLKSLRISFCEKNVHFPTLKPLRMTEWYCKLILNFKSSNSDSLHVLCFKWSNKQIINRYFETWSSIIGARTLADDLWIMISVLLVCSFILCLILCLICQRYLRVIHPPVNIIDFIPYLNNKMWVKILAQCTWYTSTTT